MDRRMDRQTDGGHYNIPFAFLKKPGDKYLKKVSKAELSLGF